MYTDYTYKTSTRAKRLRITIKPSQEVIITIPKRMSMRTAERFVQSKESWIAKQLHTASQKPAKNSFAKLTTEDYQKHKEEARRIITERVEFFNEELNYSYKRIAIRDQSTRWGSCSSNKNLNFNYKLLFLPEALRDYVVVHELCHLQQMNHSANFWKLVEDVLPNYKALRKELKTEYNL
jgi:predicted metal-dependent hydrolase